MNLQSGPYKNQPPSHFIIPFILAAFCYRIKKKSKEIHFVTAPLLAFFLFTQAIGAKGSAPLASLSQETLINQLGKTSDIKFPPTLISRARGRSGQQSETFNQR